MSEWSLILLLLGVICASILAMTIALVVTARDLRRTLQRVQGMLPACDATVHEARQLLTRTNNATRHIESVVHHVCAMATEAMAQVGSWKAGAQHLWGGRLGNGARSRSRRKHEE